MATASLISEQEYLSSSFRPDCDYVDGAVEERNLGDYEHATLQFFLAKLIESKVLSQGLQVRPELRVHVAPGRYRIPDITIFDAAIRQPVLTEPPRLCVEILSPRDTLSNISDRIRDYHRMGVPEVWVFDPEPRTCWQCVPGSMHEVTGPLVIPGTDAAIDLTAAFACLS